MGQRCAVCGAVDLKAATFCWTSRRDRWRFWAHYGFCPQTDLAIATTLRWIDSADNPHLGPAGQFQTLLVSRAVLMGASLANICFQAAASAPPRFCAGPRATTAWHVNHSMRTPAPVTGRHLPLAPGFLGYALARGCGIHREDYEMKNRTVHTVLFVRRFVIGDVLRFYRGLDRIQAG